MHSIIHQHLAASKKGSEVVSTIEPKEEKFIDITEAWTNNATPGIGEIILQTEVIIDGIKYEIGKKGVRQTPSIREIEIAKLLRDTFGGDVIILLDVKKATNHSFADYYYKGEKFDLKEIKGNKKNTIYGAIHNKKKQASNFIVDKSPVTSLSRANMKAQIEELFKRQHTRFVDKIIFTEKNEVIFVYQRKK